MSKKDLLQRFIFENAPIRGELIRLEESYQTVISQHNYPAPLKRLLGEALAVAGLLSAIIKFNGRLTVQFRGNGKLKLLLAQCDNKFHLRGLAKWDGEITDQELTHALNDGLLAILLDSGPKSRYQGVVSWRGNSLAESIEGYFRDSEQLATRIWLSTNEDRVAGFLLQMVPGQKKQLSSLEPDWERIIIVTDTLKPQEILYKDYEMLLKNLYPEDEIRVFSQTTVSFRCTCNRERGQDAILMLGKEETEAELKDKNSISVTCEFCNQAYLFDRVDVTKIFVDDKHKGSNQLH